MEINITVEKIARSRRINAPYGGAEDDDISAYENEYGTSYSQAYRNFLKRINGFRSTFSFDDCERVGVSPIVADINTIFGIGNGDSSLDLALLTPRMGFYRPRFLPFAPLIGVGGDFCTLVEINQGKYAGQIIYTDGEIASEFIDTPIEGQSVDDLVDSFIEDGWFMRAAPSFDALIQMYAKLV